MKKISIIKQGQITNQATFANDELLNKWLTKELANNSFGLPEREKLDEMGKPTGEIIPAEFTYEIEDITLEIEAEKAKIENKKKDRKDRITSLKALDWSKIDTIAKLKAIVKMLVDDSLKDEDNV